MGGEAVAFGVANRCLVADEVLAAALELARDIAVNTAPLSVAISKRLLWEALQSTPDQVAHLETELHRHVMGREDAREGVLAFLEKRAPRWELSVSEDCPDWPDVEEAET